MFYQHLYVFICSKTLYHFVKNILELSPKISKMKLLTKKNISNVYYLKINHNFVRIKHNLSILLTDLHLQFVHFKKHS